ncbi:WecB/TagA/CpsF family glycosyltransferase [Echinicola vietnamensis]|uniref:Exopolysaccharide biosynthesis protein, WecB/TagA/CpsF family n=1 Tax=Echinicola vietnamensis (strain DSM 17526 / LMG 23754 / KMM 6221) TaxID=926556 RepID=L0G290_ECHVK|nr:WecB/TagA/CpsF family glycosyltransferase [Echinicola vietnamensis]AGA78970.1 exopolysaccharide biosynthesis protein, WecB/TagA/CpsF family [Echinicola vietnamensis DSM 17526]
MKTFNKVDILGVKVANVSFEDTIDYIVDAVKNKKKTSIFTPNINLLIAAHKDQQYKDVLNTSGLLVPDGKPLVWTSKWLKQPLTEKVSGSSLFFRLCEVSAQENMRVFLLGAAPGVGDIAKQKLEKKYPGLTISGTYSPPFGFENDPAELDKIVKLLKESRSDVLVVGLGAPKQERFISKYLKAYNIPVSLGLGSSIDYAAGVQKMAPEWIKKTGLGWLYRTLDQPARLGKRYLSEGPLYFMLVMKQIAGNKKGKEIRMN